MSTTAQAGPDQHQKSKTHSSLPHCWQATKCLTRHLLPTRVHPCRKPELEVEKELIHTHHDTEQVPRVAAPPLCRMPTRSYNFWFTFIMQLISSYLKLKRTFSKIKYCHSQLQCYLTVSNLKHKQNLQVIIHTMTGLM